MTANIQWGKGVFDNPNKRGGETPNPITRADDLALVPLFQMNSATLLLQYVVPAGKVETLKNLLVGVIPPGNMFAPAGAGLRMGTALLVVDGTTKAELSIQNFPIHSPSLKVSVDWRNAVRGRSLGEGVDFTSGQVIKVQATPLEPAAGLILASKWIAELHGKNPVTGAADLRIGTLRSPASGAALDILSYTAPAQGFRLMSWDVKGYYTEPWCATVQVYINGSCITELGYLTFHGETTTFAPQGHYGVINLLKGGWGIKLNHGDRVEVWAHALLDFGQAATVQMACNETSEIGVQPNYLIGV